MNNLKVFGVVAALALILPLAAPTASFAQHRGFAGRGGGGHVFAGGGGGGRVFGGGGARIGMGSPAFRGTPAAPAFSGRRAAVAAGPIGGWRGTGRRSGGFLPGFVAGAAIGSVAAYPYYYGDSYYSGYDYDDSPAVAVAPDTAVVPDTGGDDAVAYCMQRYRSYDPASGTYLGYDGLRHPCP